MKATKVIRQFHFEDGTHVDLVVIRFPGRRWPTPDLRDVPLEHLRARAIELHGVVRAIRVQEALSRAYGDQAGDDARAAADEQHTELDDLIRACLDRGDPLRVKEWAHKCKVHKTTVYRRIKLQRPK